MTSNREQQAKAIHEKADTIFRRLRELKAETEALLETSGRTDQGGLEISEEALAGMLAIRSELGISQNDLAQLKTRFHVRDEPGADCHWCTASAGA